MRVPKIIAAGLVFVFALGLITGYAQETAQRPQKESKKQVAKPSEKVIIPKEIKAIMQEGLATRQGRQDIPFTIFKHMIFPAKDSLHTVFFFRAKNADLGFAVPPAPGAPAQGQAPTPPPAAGALQARLHVFLEFFRPDEAGAPKAAWENYCPVAFQEDGATYKPDAEEWYTVGRALLPGKYTLAMALASPDLKKVGVGYYEFEIPGPESYKTTLETTSIFFLKKVEQLQAVERMTIHKGFFVYSVLQIVPNLENIVAPGDQIEIFYFILGAKPKEAEPGQQAKNEIEVDYHVEKEDGSLAIRWSPQKYDSALVPGQALPLKQTVQITDDKGKRTETRDLGPGKYNLVLKISDKVSGETLEKKVPFEVK